MHTHTHTHIYVFYTYLLFLYMFNYIHAIAHVQTYTPKYKYFFSQYHCAWNDIDCNSLLTMSPDRPGMTDILSKPDIVPAGLTKGYFVS